MKSNEHPIIEAPSPWVARFAGLIPRGDVLDVACGRGRHARLLQSLGYSVLAIDRDPSALAEVSGAGIATLRIDLESSPDGKAVWPFGARRFSGIVVTNYLHRPLLQRLTASLAPGGVLIYETFAQGNEAFGKPSNPDFLLAPGELLDMAANASPRPLEVIAYESGQISRPRLAAVQRLCAVRIDQSGRPPLMPLN